MVPLFPIFGSILLKKIKLALDSSSFKTEKRLFLVNVARSVWKIIWMLRTIKTDFLNGLNNYLSIMNFNVPIAGCFFLKIKRSFTIERRSLNSSVVVVSAHLVVDERQAWWALSQGARVTKGLRQIASWWRADRHRRQLRECRQSSPFWRRPPTWNRGIQ